MDNNNKMHGEDREQMDGMRQGSMNTGNPNQTIGQHNQHDNSGMHAGGEQGSSYREQHSTGDSSQKGMYGHSGSGEQQSAGGKMNQQGLDEKYQSQQGQSQHGQYGQQGQHSQEKHGQQDQYKQQAQSQFEQKEDGQYGQQGQEKYGQKEQGQYGQQDHEKYGQKEHRQYGEKGEWDSKKESGCGCKGGSGSLDPEKKGEKTPGNSY